MSSQGAYISKGARIRAQWFDTRLVGLAGNQMKLGANARDVIGIVRHVRGDHPVTPTQILLYLDVDPVPEGLKTTKAYGCKCVNPHVEIKPSWIVAEELHAKVRFYRRHDEFWDAENLTLSAIIELCKIVGTEAHVSTADGKLIGKVRPSGFWTFEE
jgi:hypothetical protein